MFVLIHLLFIFWIFVFVLIHFHNLLTCFEKCFAEIIQNNSSCKSVEEQAPNSPKKSVEQEVPANDPAGN